MTDGVFAFAMTLLVVNIELPEGFRPKGNQEFLKRLSVSDTFIAYLITFFVLVSFWFGRAKENGEPEMASAVYAWAVLLHLGRSPFCRSRCSRLADTTYPRPSGSGANMIPLSLTAIAISLIAERDSGRERIQSGRVELAILIAPAVASMVTSLFAPDFAMLLYVLNLASPLVARAFYQR